MGEVWGGGKLTVGEERDEGGGGARELGLDCDADARVPMGKRGQPLAAQWAGPLTSAAYRVRTKNTNVSHQCLR